MGFFNIFKKKNKKIEDEKTINQGLNKEIKEEEQAEDDSHPKETVGINEIEEISQNNEEDELDETSEKMSDILENEEIIEDEKDINQEQSEEVSKDDTHPEETEKSIENSEVEQSESEEDEVEENLDEDTNNPENDETVEDEKTGNLEKTEEIAENEENEIDKTSDENSDNIENEETIDTHPEEKNKKSPEKAAEKKGLFKRLRRGLSKTSNKIVGGMESVFLGKKEIDEDLLEELEELLITADMGVSTSLNIIEEVREEVSRKILKNPQELKTALKKKIYDILNVDNSLVQTEDRPYVVLVIGVNGVGKTTSIAKLANMFKNEGLKTMLAAGDTFRAAAVDQLKIWAERVGVPVVAQQEGSDPAAVIFDAVQSAKAKKFDVLIADTAGRLHTKYNLMNELEKVIRVMKKELPDAPHELLLVLDATAGQNAISQAKQFQSMIGATGIILTKLDGTAKGGVIVGIVDELNIPVKFIGFGEGMEDLRPFNAKSFVDALFADESGENEKN